MILPDIPTQDMLTEGVRKFLATRYNYTEASDHLKVVFMAMVSKAPCHWISVLDRLPATEGRYLIFAPRNGVGTRQFNLSQYGPKSHSWSLNPGITHWMELPQPPKANI